MATTNGYLAFEIVLIIGPPPLSPNGANSTVADDRLTSTIFGFDYTVANLPIGLGSLLVLLWDSESMRRVAGILEVFSADVNLKWQMTVVVQDNMSTIPTIIIV